MLSTLHQSSLGSLYLIMPQKLHPYWYTPLLPVFFFLSAIAIGLAMTIFESSLTAKHFGKRLELPLLRDLGSVLLVVLLVYSVLRAQDLFHRGALALLLQGGYETRLLLLELGIGLVAPIGLLLVPRVRHSAGGLYLSAVLTILGFITNRLNVSITGMEASAAMKYVPRWTEVAITASIIAVGFAAFGLAAKHLPIFPTEARPMPTLAGGGAHLILQEKEPVAARR
jgi:Ni/Fe-hydrogenase subunit HybB-like protein